MTAKQTLLALAAATVLAGCATTQAPTGVSKVESQPQAAAVLKPPAVIPSGPLSEIKQDELESHHVVALQPPPDLWVRIRAGFKMPDLDNDLVHQQEQWYASRPDYMQRMTDRSRKYLFHIVEELERRGMPTELALLPFIESAFNPQAVSSARAAGMWQFMPQTGRDYDLKQNVFRDDRRDVLASTRAALDYLQKLYGMFGDWHLALAAYNWGEGNVSRAIARNQAKGLGVTYEDLPMPNETRNYVPKLQAVKNIIANPEQFHAELPLIENHPYFQTVTVQRDIDVALAAKFADVDIADFKELNPHLKQPVILAAGTPEILLPWDNAAVFKRNFADYSDGRFASWTAWAAPATMSVSEAARRVGMSESDMRSVNSIPPRMLIKAGSVLIVPRTGNRTEDVAGPIADSGQLSLAPEIVTRRIVVRAGKHDTVSTIARRYKVAPAQVAQWNDVGMATRFRPGQHVVLHVQSRASAARHPHIASKAVVRTRAAAHASKKPAAHSKKLAAKPAAKSRGKVAARPRHSSADQASR